MTEIIGNGRGRIGLESLGIRLALRDIYQRVNFA